MRTFGISLNLVTRTRRVYRKGRRAGSSQSHLSKARQAFRTQQVVKFAESNYGYFKTPYGEKQVVLLGAATPSDLAAILGVVQGAADVSDSLRQYCAAQRIKNTTFFKNVCTYQIRVRVSTWVARRDAPIVTPTAGSQMASIVSYLEQGFLPPYTATPLTFNSSTIVDVSTSMFQNPLWCHYFKCVKVRNHTIMPYRTKKFVLSAAVSRPGWIWAEGNARSTPLADAGVGYVAVKRWGGFTTRYMSFEFTGEIANDATMAPNTLVTQSPVVMLTQQKYEFEGAAPGESVQNWTVGDGTKVVIDEMLTGQPWNYMFPAPSSSSSVGTSAVIGSLTSGL